jgi:hypothetical protein
MRRETEISLPQLARSDVFATPAIAAAVAGVRRAVREIACDPKLRRLLEQETAPLENYRGASVSDSDRINR